MDKTSPSIATAPAWARPARFRFRCTACREVHHGLPEICFELPEPIACLPIKARRRRSLLDGDMAILDGKRYFLRAQLSTPVETFDQRLIWAVWVETSWTSFKAGWPGLIGVAEAAMLPKPFKGRLASTIGGFGATRGLSGIVEMEPSAVRPTFTIAKTGRQADHLLVRAQTDGVPASFALQEARKVAALVIVT